MKRIHNKEDIIQVGLDIVLSRGFTATGVEAILKHANVPKGSFYNFFSSKEEFALAIIAFAIAADQRGLDGTGQHDRAAVGVRFERVQQGRGEAEVALHELVVIFGTVDTR